MRKVIVGLGLAAALLAPSALVLADVATTTEPVHHKTSGTSACFYLLALGAKWCSDTPELQALWAQGEVRQFIIDLWAAQTFK